MRGGDDGSGGTAAPGLKEVAREFSAVIYGMLVEQMRRTVKDEDAEDDGGAVGQGAEDLLAMFLPRALAGESTDPLTVYILEDLSRNRGVNVDEAA